MRSVCDGKFEYHEYGTVKRCRDHHLHGLRYCDRVDYCIPANTVDYGEWKMDSVRKASSFPADIRGQLASAFSVLIAGVGLDLVGLDVDAAVQTDATLGLRFLRWSSP